jgi:hypothetical protein
MVYRTSQLVPSDDEAYPRQKTNYDWKALAQKDNCSHECTAEGPS